MNAQIVKKSKNTALIIGIVLLGIIIVIGVVLLIIFEKEYDDCKRLESPLCLTGNCLQPSTNCQGSPFKVEDGQYVCKSSILQQQNIPRVNFN